MAMLRARDALSGVNVMAMAFSGIPSSPGGMMQAVESSLTSSARQLAADFSKVGLHTSGSAVWHHLGVTVMIGQNAEQGQRFTTRDASSLTRFATSTGLARVSFWSLNRDRQCGGVYPITGVDATTCSGTPQPPLAFSKAFGRLNGTVAHEKRAVLPPQPDTNPANAPYPLWSPTASYPQGYKIVRQGEIYEAKWYNAGEDPAAQVEYSWQTPWELLGPVLPTDHAPTLPKLPAGTYPGWSVTTQYQAGATVLYQGLPYRAKWNNQGISPLVGTAANSGSPWQPLFVIPGEPSSNPSGSSSTSASAP
jgi:chitinase